MIFPYAFFDNPLQVMVYVCVYGILMWAAFAFIDQRLS